MHAMLWSQLVFAFFLRAAPKDIFLLSSEIFVQENFHQC